MRRPRRPILAAVCAALLLATVVLWLRSWTTFDVIAIRRGPNVISAGSSCGSILISYIPGELFDFRVYGPVRRQIEYRSQKPVNYATITWPAAPKFRILGVLFVAVQAPPPPPAPAYIYYGTGPFRSYALLFPFWVVLIPSAAGLWWSCRRPNPKPGFPIEPAKETA